MLERVHNKYSPKHVANQRMLGADNSQPVPDDDELQNWATNLTEIDIQTYFVGMTNDYIADYNSDKRIAKTLFIKMLEAGFKFIRSTDVVTEILHWAPKYIWKIQHPTLEQFQLVGRRDTHTLRYLAHPKITEQMLSKVITNIPIYFLSDPTKRAKVFSQLGYPNRTSAEFNALIDSHIM